MVALSTDDVADVAGAGGASAQLTLAFGGAYDRLLDVPALAAERGLAVGTRILPSPKDAFGALRDDESLAGGEMSVSFYITEWSRSRETSDLVALPVWVSRAFRHGNLYVREDSDLVSPEQLRGRRVGLPEYGMTMAVWLRGLFEDQYAVAPADIAWVTHRPPAGLEPDAVHYPDDVSITPLDGSASLPQLLLSGEIDAWIGAGTAPPPVGIRRLFADPRAEEEAYFKTTGIFPVMHVMVLKRAVVDAAPHLAAALFEVFDEAKRRAQRRLWSTSVSYATMPWTLASVEAQTAAMGGDPWPYGIEANRVTLEALITYMHRQGLLWGPVRPDDCFLQLEPQAR